MNRRDFLTITSLTPFCTNELFATNNISKDTINKFIFISKNELVTSAILKKRLKRYVGFANFNILDFNIALFYSRNYPKIGAFTKNELILIDKLFYKDPLVYGFYGAKTTLNIGNKIKKSTIKKIKRTGHFLFKGKPLSDYKRLKYVSTRYTKNNKDGVRYEPWHIEVI
jgi:hypothetical protein